ncbi:unnamed protein product [Cylicocyclus nassatus]|uniref:Uncharacterized protein n=1 Tax=Cylicocyclus nassatus TaxID=53992 RepID=A0AA36MCN1_CYLNA|nr:unnamed protein product [Cylicocyclus nassatus]
MVALNQDSFTMTLSNEVNTAPDVVNEEEESSKLSIEQPPLVFVVSSTGTQEQFMIREITVKHPAAKSMIEIARTQDEETGDRITSVIVLDGEDDSSTAVP